MGTATCTYLPSERIFLVCRRMKFFAFILALMAVTTAVPAVDDRHDHDHDSASGYDYYGSGSGYDYYGSGYDYYGSGDYGEVWCGGHAAQSCAACPQGHGAAWCNGDCAWTNDQCELSGVSCGGHKASTCAECPQGFGEAWCNGDC